MFSSESVAKACTHQRRIHKQKVEVPLKTASLRCSDEGLDRDVRREWLSSRTDEKLVFSSLSPPQRCGGARERKVEAFTTFLPLAPEEAFKGKGKLKTCR